MNKQEQLETELAEMALEEETPLYNEQRADAIYKILKKENIHSVLDVGCGLGKVTVYLAKKGLDAMGIDVSPKLIMLAQEKAKKHNLNIDFKVTRLDKLKCKKKFDAVLFAGVLEHIKNDKKLMEQAKRILKDNGKIVIEVPCIPFLYNPRDKRIGHVLRYSKNVLRERLKAAGYINIKFVYYNFLMIFGNLYLLIFNKKEYPYGAINPITNRLIYWWYKYLENNFMFPIGEKLYAIGTIKKGYSKGNK